MSFDPHVTADLARHISLELPAPVFAVFEVVQITPWNALGALVVLPPLVARAARSIADPQQDSAASAEDAPTA